VELVRYTLCWADPNGPCIPVTGVLAPGNMPPWLVRAISTKNMVANPTGSLGGIVPPLTSSVALVEVIVQNPAVAPNAILPDGSRNTPMFQYICSGGAAFCTVEQIDSVIVTVRTRGATQDVQTRRFRAVTVQGMARRLNPSR
jgi:hypothetical protein